MKKITIFVIGFIVGAIIFSGISIYATKSYLASEIQYKDGTVDTALNDLYGLANTNIIDSLLLTPYMADSYGVKENSKTAIYENIPAGTYLVFGGSSFSGTRAATSESNSVTNSQLPGINVTNGSCNSISDIRQNSTATAPINGTSKYIYDANYNRAWLCTITATSDISVYGHSSIGNSNDSTSSTAIIAIRLR